MPPDGVSITAMARVGRILIVLALVLVVVAVGLVIARKPIVSALAIAYLEREGFGPVELRVSALDPEVLEFELVLVGPEDGPHVRVRRILVGFDGIEVSSVALHGVIVAAQREHGALDVGPLTALLEGPVDGPNADPSRLPSLPTDLPPLSLHDFMLTVKDDPDFLMLRMEGSYRLEAGRLTGGGPFSVVSADARGEGALSVTVDADLAGVADLNAHEATFWVPGLSGPLRFQSLDVALARQSGLISADIAGETEGGIVTASLLIATPFDRPAIDMGVQANFDDLSGLLAVVAEAVGETPVTGGSADLALAMVATADDGVIWSDIGGLIDSMAGEARLAGSFRLPADVHPAGERTGAIAADLEADGRLRDGFMNMNFNELKVRVEKFVEPDALKPLAISHASGLTLRARPGLQATVTLSDPFSLSLAGAVDAESAPLRLAAELGDTRISEHGLKATGTNIRLTGLAFHGQQLDQLRFGGDVELTDGVALHGRFEAAAGLLSLTDSTAGDLSASLEMDIAAHTAERFRIMLDGTVNAGLLSVAADAATLSNSEIGFDDFSFAMVPGKGMVVKGVVEGASGHVNIAGMEGMPITVSPWRADVDLDGYGFGTMYGSVDLRGEGVSVADVASTGPIRLAGKVRPSPQSLRAEVAIDELRVDPALGIAVPTAAFNGVLDATDAGASLAGRLKAGAAGVDISAVADKASGTGEARIALPETALSVLSDLLRGGVLPEGMELTDGHLNGDMDFSLGKGLSGNLAVSVRNGGVTVPEVKLSDINTSLQLESLVPPATRGVQQVRIGRLSGPFEMTDLELRFVTQQEGAATVARVEHLAGSVFGGELAILPFTLRPEEERRPIKVALSRIDMAEIVDLAGLEDFILTGSLSGTLPVEIVGENGVVVRQGKLVADGPGTLQLDGNVLRGILGQQGGEEVDLMIRTLEDFRYDLLEVSLDKPLEGETTMLVTLGGLNPAVLDGHPFRFNISVSGDADRLLATILTVYRASSGVIEQGIKSLQ